MDRLQIEKVISEQNVKFIRLQFTDIFGTLKNVSIPISQLTKALDNDIMFDGSSVEGFVRIEESDMYLRPDLNTFCILPFDECNGKSARIICDVYRPDGKQFEGDPRYILKKVLNEAKKMGFTFQVGPECEFFLFKIGEDGLPTMDTNDQAGYFDLGPIDKDEETREEIVNVLEKMGFEIEASHHEVAPGQHEIDFKYADALKTADNVMTFKLVVKEIARKHNLHATFMPKPISGINGSGMHTNQSLFKDNINTFYDEKDIIGLSKIAYNFIGGILKNASVLSAITNPIINSYKRLIPGYEAPVNIAWSTSNRSPLIRIPAARGKGTRIELRNPDPACNPYLAFACILKAGLDGIKNNINPPEQISENIFDMDDNIKNEKDIGKLPANLFEALKELEKNNIVKDTLGQHAYDYFVKAKMIEWNEYISQVHNWEVDKYLWKY